MDVSYLSTVQSKLSRINYLMWVQVVVIVVFWKDSIDFQRIIKRKDQMKV